VWARWCRIEEEAKDDNKLRTDKKQTLTKLLRQNWVKEESGSSVLWYNHKGNVKDGFQEWLTGAQPHEMHHVLASLIQDIRTDLLVAEATSAVSRLVCKSGLPPAARQMEWLRNNYFLFSLISKNGIQMEAEASNVNLKSRAQTGTQAKKSGSESVLNNQILLWTIANWAHHQDIISLWQLTIKNKLEE